MDPNLFNYTLIAPDYKVLKGLAEETGLDIGKLAEVSIGLAGVSVLLVRLQPKQSVENVESNTDGNTNNGANQSTGNATGVSDAGTGI